MTVAVLALAGLVAFLLWSQPKLRAAFGLKDWRPALGLVVLVALVGAVALGLRGLWLPAGLLASAALWAGLFVRRRPEAEARVDRVSMSPAEARQLLGVSDGATVDEVEEAYRRLMRRAHPDLGGSTGLAAQLNAARRVLLPR